MLNGMRILVVDDSPEDRELYTFGLGLERARVRTAATADEALRLLDTEPFDAVVSDLEMPGGDGFALIRLIRLGGLRMPAIAVSGYVREQDRRRAFAAGFDDFCGKPCPPDELIEVLLRHVGRPSRE